MSTQIICTKCDALFHPAHWQLKHRCYRCRDCRLAESREKNRRPEFRERARKLYHVRKKNPVEHKKMVSRWKAYRNIKIDRPCECGEKAIHRHHDDYSKQLDVQLLCQNCHEKRHHKLAEVEGR